jgi:protein tyrosine/serine phosphatase
LPGLPNFAQVSDALYRGGQPTPAGFERLKETGIRTVVDVRGKSHVDHIEGLGMKYIQIPTSVSRPDRQQVIQFLRIVRDPQNQPVFVHDDLGGDRAGLYVAVYRMAEQGWTARDAELELPRFGFDKYWTQIPAFLDRLDVGAIRADSRRPPTTQTLPAPSRP